MSESVSGCILNQSRAFVKYSMSDTEIPEKNLPARPVLVLPQFNFEEGETLLFDKPLYWTSFDLVKKVRNTIKFKKIGHAGTLDPLATGLLILCTGKKTKTIESLMGAEKEYTGTLCLGKTTASYDAESPVTASGETSLITPDQIKAATKLFSGEVMQRPPLFSAVMINGTRAYTLARRGDESTLPAERPVQIYSFEITGIEMPLVHFKVRCGKGTYIRSLAHDFGQVLGCGAYLTALRRTEIGAFKVTDAYLLDRFVNLVKGKQNSEEPIID